MKEDMQSSVNSSEFIHNNASDLFSLLEWIPLRIEALRAVRKNGKIIDYEYIFLNKAAKTDTRVKSPEGKTFWSIQNNLQLFDLMVAATETGITVPTPFILSPGMQYLVHCLKWNDGVILCYTNSPATVSIPENRLKNASESYQEEKQDMEQNKRMTNSTVVFKNIVEATDDAIICIDRDGCIQYWNPASEKILGYSAKEVVSKQIDDVLFIRQTNRDHWKSLLAIAGEKNTSGTMHVQCRRKNGSHLDSLINVFPVKNADSDTTGKCVTIKDISAISNREKMGDDDHFIDQVMDTTPDIIFIMDLDTCQVIYANRRIAADLGYTRKQIDAMRNPIMDIMHEEDIPAMFEHLKHMKELKSDDKILEIEYRLKNANGGINWFCDRNAVFKRDEQGVPIQKIGISQDITARKIQEQQINTSIGILSQAEQIAGIGSWEYEINTKTLKCSDGMYRLFNVNPGAKITPDIYLECTEENEQQKAKAVLSNIREKFTPFEETLTIALPGQEKKIIKTKAIVAYDNKNRPVRVIGVDMDITPQVKAAEEIGSLNKILINNNRDLEALNTELKTFNTVASRDYKETIQTLYTNLEYIASREARNLSDMAKGNIRKAQAAIQRMKLLTEDINSYLRLYDVTVNKSAINPEKILSTVLASMRGRIEQAAATVDSVDLPPLHADPELVGQLFSHLIDNSIKFRKPETPPVIRFTSPSPVQTNIGESNPVTYTIITISDNGIGFTEEEGEKVFDLFHRLHDKAKYRGSGIGLAACRKIMAMHNGYITTKSSPGEGAAFSCYFPNS